MSSGNTELSIDGILKEYYRDGSAINTTYEKHPLWALLAKKEATPNVTGRQFVHSVVFAGSSGMASGGNFSYAQTSGQATSMQSVAFLTNRYENIRDFSIATEAVLSTRGDRGAFESIVTLESDNALRNLANSQEIFMFGTGTAAVAQVGSIVGNTIVLASSTDGVKFEDGMELDAAVSAGTGGLLAYGSALHGLYVGAVDRQNGVLTTTVSQTQGAAQCSPTDATNGIPTLAAGNYLFYRTFRNNVMQGLESWIPFGGPSSTLFNGVNRTLDNVRLAGQSLDATQLSPEDMVIQSTVAVELQGESLTHFIVPWNYFAKFQKSGVAKEVVVQETEYDVSFSGINVMSPSGPITVLPARNCPSNRVYGINISSWEYTYMGKESVFMWDLDGNMGLRQPNDDGIEYRFVSFGNLVCHRPSANITMKV
jgi:hypothetical protein